MLELLLLAFCAGVIVKAVDWMDDDQPGKHPAKFPLAVLCGTLDSAYCSISIGECYRRLSWLVSHARKTRNYGSLSDRSLPCGNFESLPGSMITRSNAVLNVTPSSKRSLTPFSIC